MSKLKIVIAIAAFLSMLACKRTDTSSQTQGASAEALEHDKKLHDLAPDYLNLGSLDKSGLRHVRLGIFIDCDPFASTDNIRNDRDLCLPDSVTKSSNYGDQVFRQMITWLAGYTLKDDLKLESIDSANPFVDVTKMDELKSTDTSREISFTGKGPAIDHRKEESAGYTQWDITISLRSKNTDMLKAMAAGIRNYDVLYVAGSIYAQGDLVGDKVNDEKALTQSLSAMTEDDAIKSETSVYKAIVINSCFSETLEDSLLSTWDSAEAKLSKQIKLDIMGQRGKSNYRHFTQQLARILSNLHEGNNWIDILKGMKIVSDDTSDENSPLKAAFQRQSLAFATIPVLRNNKELIDRKLDRSALFDENGLRSNE